MSFALSLCFGRFFGGGLACKQAAADDGVRAVALADGVERYVQLLLFPGRGGVRFYLSDF